MSAPATRDRGQGRPGWLAHPALSVLLAAVWLLLQQSLAPAQLVAAAVFGLVVPRLVHGFIGPAVRLHAPWTMVRLFVVVLWDIVVSNLTVARIVLNPASDPQPAWVPVPLDGTHPNVATLLATIITMTPGTVSCVVDESEHHILVHALDCDDPALLRLRLVKLLQQKMEVEARLAWMEQGNDPSPYEVVVKSVPEVPVASLRQLVPHAGEMGRLLGIEAAEVEAHRLDAALKLARECGAIVVLKGDDTIVSDGDRVAVNALPAPSLATAGTGDVLAGVCGAFLGRGLEPFEAAAAAVICHARAGRLAASGIGSAEGVVATDVIASLPPAMSIAPPDDRG